MADSPQKLSTLLKRLTEKGTPQQYALLFHKYHEADIAETLSELPLENQIQFFNQVQPEISVEVLEEMDISHQIQLMQDFKIAQAAKLIEEMDPDDAADILEELLEENEQKAEEIIEALPEEEAEDIKELLAYPEESAGALMTSEFLFIPENLTVGQAIEKIKSQNPPNSEISFYIFVVDDQDRLIGHTTLRDLLISSADQTVRSIRNDYPIKVNVLTDQEEVARQFQKYDVVVLPVVDKNDTLVGLITVDDIVDVVVEEATEDIYKLSGTADISESKLLTGHLKDAVLSRLPWLILTVFGGFIASAIITWYASHYSFAQITLALSLSFVPMMMGLSGNVGNQSATIIVRGLATGIIKKDRPIRYILRETAVGLIIGGSLSALVIGLNLVMGHSLLLSLIVGLGMFINIWVAALIGGSLPLILNRIQVDPAVASAPFISTTLDIVGQLIYFCITFFVLLNIV